MPPGRRVVRPGVHRLACFRWCLGQLLPAVAAESAVATASAAAAYLTTGTVAAASGPAARGVAVRLQRVLGWPYAGVECS